MGCKDLGLPCLGFGERRVSEFWDFGFGDYRVFGERVQGIGQTTTDQ